MPARLGEFFSVWLFTSLSPGPAALIIMALSLQGGMARAWRGILGIMAGHLILFSILWTGLHFSIQSSGSGFLWIQRLGAFYLIFIGVQLLLDALKAPKEDASKKQAIGSSPFLQSLFTQLFNPRAILFTLALLPGFLVKDKALLPQLLLLGSIMLPIDFLVLMGYAWLAATGSSRFKNQTRWINALAGLFILYVGIHLVMLIK